MILDKPILSERLLYRTLNDNDAVGSYLGWVKDPAIIKFLDVRFTAQSEDGLRDFIAEKNRSPDDLLLGMFSDDGTVHIGNIKLTIDRSHNRGDIGLLIGDQASWGQGLASEAISTLSDYARDPLRLHRVYAGCVAENIGSEKAFIKSGFIKEGTLKDHWSDGSSWFDVIILGKVLAS